MAYRGVILDVGGTLLDTDAIHQRAWVDVLGEWDLGTSSNVAAAHEGLRRGLDTFATARLILGRSEDADQLARAKQRAVSLNTGAKAVARTVRWLDAQERDVRAAISFSDEAWTRAMLQSAGILDRFAFTLGRVDDHEVDKRLLLDRAIRLLNAEWSASSFLFVGDTELDRGIAAERGLDFVYAAEL